MYVIITWQTGTGNVAMSSARHVHPYVRWGCRPARPQRIKKSPFFSRLAAKAESIIGLFLSICFSVGTRSVALRGGPVVVWTDHQRRTQISLALALGHPPKTPINNSRNSAIKSLALFPAWNYQRLGFRWGFIHACISHQPMHFSNAGAFLKCTCISQMQVHFCFIVFTTRFHSWYRTLPLCITFCSKR